MVFEVDRCWVAWCHFLYKICVYVHRKGIFSLARAEAALAENFLCGGGAREKDRLFSATRPHRPAIQKMLQWIFSENAPKRGLGGLLANYNQDSLFGLKGGAWQSLRSSAQVEPISPSPAGAAAHACAVGARKAGQGVTFCAADSPLLAVGAARPRVSRSFHALTL